MRLLYTIIMKKKQKFNQNNFKRVHKFCKFLFFSLFTNEFEFSKNEFAKVFIVTFFIIFSHVQFTKFYKQFCQEWRGCFISPIASRVFRARKSQSVWYLLRCAADAGPMTVHLIFVVFGHGALAAICFRVEIVHVHLFVLLRNHWLIPESKKCKH